MGINRKHGRNEAFCKAYAAEGRREKNKAAKIARHLRKCPWDAVARSAFEALPQIAKRGHTLPPPQPKPANGVWRRVSHAVKANAA